MRPALRFAFTCSVLTIAKQDTRTSAENADSVTRVCSPRSHLVASFRLRPLTLRRHPAPTSRPVPRHRDPHHPLPPLLALRLDPVLNSFSSWPPSRPARALERERPRGTHFDYDVECAAAKGLPAVGQQGQGRRVDQQPLRLYQPRRPVQVRTALRLLLS